ncbi:MAG: GTP cyclohydrolase I FolE [Actinobacteria bacterium ATB1]|nr:GTP cyclohydrolase I FolE [Actinobacteria bacterium ATB1]
MNEYEHNIDGPELRATVDRSKIEDAIRLIIEAIGEDPNRPGLKRTPERVADMYADLFSGVGQDAREALSVVFEEGHDELVMVRDIPFYSLCEHHLVPFHGRAHVGYLPNDRGEITGLSKLARVVEVVARRPQVQERLTSEIADVIMEVLDAKGSMVIIEAEHLCMSMRGVRKPGAVTVTSAVRGIFKSNPATRAEAMSLLRHTTG